MAERTISSPVGAITIRADGGKISALTWGGRADDDDPLLSTAAAQLDEYFSGRRRGFDLPLALPDGGFQRDILQALIDIPYGETQTYGDIAKALGVSPQAIGQACGGNRIPILIPCHRVLAANSLGGYSGAGGVETKVALLKLEGAGGLLL